MKTTFTKVKNFARFYVLSFLLMSVLAACATYSSVGAAPSATPPRIINHPIDPQQRDWDHPSAFGPVPANLAAKGQAVCNTLNSAQVQFKAIGYHPKAQNYEGQTMAEGGYYCIPK